MPGGRYFPNMAYYNSNGKIYVIGGFDASFVESATTWEYDPVANSWNTARLNIPVAMAGSTTSIAGQFIYLVGTWNTALGSTLHYRYDITNNSWATMAPAPVNIYEAAGGAMGGLTYLVGGGNPARPAGPRPGLHGLSSGDAPTVSYNSTYIYDIAGNSWLTGPNTNALGATSLIALA